MDIDNDKLNQLAQTLTDDQRLLLPRRARRWRRGYPKSGQVHTVLGH